MSGMPLRNSRTNLHERAARMNRKPLYIDKHVTIENGAQMFRFVCELVVDLPNGDRTTLQAEGKPCTTKKAGQEDAARKMLEFMDQVENGVDPVDVLGPAVQPAPSALTTRLPPSLDNHQLSESLRSFSRTDPSVYYQTMRAPPQARPPPPMHRQPPRDDRWEPARPQEEAVDPRLHRGEGDSRGSRGGWRGRMEADKVNEATEEPVDPRVNRRRRVPVLGILPELDQFILEHQKDLGLNPNGDEKGLWEGMTDQQKVAYVPKIKEIFGKNTDLTDRDMLDKLKGMAAQVKMHAEAEQAAAARDAERARAQEAMRAKVKVEPGLEAEGVVRVKVEEGMDGPSGSGSRIGGPEETGNGSAANGVLPKRAHETRSAEDIGQDGEILEVIEDGETSRGPHRGVQRRRFEADPPKARSAEPKAKVEVPPARPPIQLSSTGALVVLDLDCEAPQPPLAILETHMSPLGKQETYNHQICKVLAFTSAYRKRLEMPDWVEVIQLKYKNIDADDYLGIVQISMAISMRYGSRLMAGRTPRGDPLRSVIVYSEDTQSYYGRHIAYLLTAEYGVQATHCEDVIKFRYNLGKLSSNKPLDAIQ